MISAPWMKKKYILYQEQGKKSATDMKAVFLETSAKDNQNANDIFMKSILEIEKVDIVQYQNENDLVCSQANGNIADDKKSCVVS